VNTRRTSLLLVVGLFVTGPAVAAQDTTVTRRTVEHGVMRVRGGMLTPGDTKALGSRFTGLRAIPDSVSIRVGQIALFDSIQVVAVDSSGRALGRLPVFNTRVQGDAGSLLLFRGIQGDKPGVTILTLTVARPFWFRTDMAPPATQLKVTVHE